jgi:hypothetical protein
VRAQVGRDLTIVNYFDRLLGLIKNLGCHRIQQVVPYDHIREILGFQKGAPEKVDVPEGMLDGFWNLIYGEAHQQ